MRYPVKARLKAGKGNPPDNEVSTRLPKKNPKAEIRNPNDEPLRASGFGLLSDFGFRYSDFSVTLLRDLLTNPQLAILMPPKTSMFLAIFNVRV